MKSKGNTNWIHLAMLGMIATLTGGWLIYYINITAAEEAAPRYYLYKVVRDETKDAVPLSNPETGYGKITVKGKITGTDMMTAALNDYFKVDGKYWQEYVGKFVEATGYLAKNNDQAAEKNPLMFDIESIKLAAENDVDDTGKACETSTECRNQCVTGKCVGIAIIK